MGLLCSFVDEHIEEIVEKGLRVIAIGRLDGLPPKVQSKISEAMEKTSSNKGGTVILALNYGGRAEIVDAARRLAVKAAKGEIEAEAIDESVFASNLYAPGVPDPDLMIRTSGEMRLSNFLLWELSYSEFYVTDVLWPDFDESSLREAMESFKGRGRRFGGVKC
jgi:undecaprenyl diphosphate synthase